MGGNAAAASSRPAQWVVVWGQPGRSDWKVERVSAFDDEEALVVARDLHRELGRPTAAFLARSVSPWVQEDQRRSGDGSPATGDRTGSS